MRYMMSYDLMETVRNTNQWIGASALAMASYPLFGAVPNPAIRMMAAWGEVAERSFARMVAKPDWGIDAVVTNGDARDHIVTVETEVARPFGDLIRFRVQGRPEMKRKVLLVAPMSGHYATLLRSTVQSLLPDCEVWITDWHNARDIPVSAGKFDVEDYTLYLAEFMRILGPTINVIAVCQPAPLALAAAALLAEDDPKAQPRSLTLIGGPIDPDAARTDVTDFGRRVTMGQLEQSLIQRVGFKYEGVGRLVYPGLLQLSSFMSMNAESHSRAFADQIMRVSKGEAGDHDKHNKFYDEYLAVMDMPAEFYLSTVERVFKERHIAQNKFTVEGRKIDIGKITDVAVKVVEGERDDISAPGQCLAALDLLTGLPDSKKAAHLEPKAGHYGIFAGKSWRNNIRPLVLDFIDQSAPKPAAKPARRTAAKRAAPAAAKTAAKPAPAKAKPAAAAKAKTASTTRAKTSAAKPAAGKKSA
ncbi:MAG: polyhydroxyalkanoate depolymerase [Silicimonas sp.]|nr:polyhydroxyalkanoate depolymerase [Silicimonas sp.]